jgi:hypothetical protein
MLELVTNLDMKKIINLRLQLKEFLNTWNCSIATVWLLIYLGIFSLIAFVTSIVRIIEIYIQRDHMIIIFLSVISVILIHDAMSYNNITDED